MKKFIVFLISIIVILPIKQNYYSASSAYGEELIDSDVYYGGVFLWPVPGYYYISAGYASNDSVHKGTHYGIDIAGGGISGKPVVAIADGYVYKSNGSCTHNYGKKGSCGCGCGYGNYVAIDHGSQGGTNYKAYYAHMASITVSTGNYVKKGQVIGYVGSTGWSTGYNLHFGIMVNNSWVNPMMLYKYQSVSDIDSNYIKIGDELTVTVNFDFAEPAYAVQFSILYNEDIFSFLPQDDSTVTNKNTIKYVNALDGKTSLTYTLKFKAISAGVGSIIIKDSVYVGASNCELTIPDKIIIAESHIPDVNGDGVIDILDLVRLKKRICGIIGDESAGSFDINGDGDVNSLDLAKLQKAIIG